MRGNRAIMKPTGMIGQNSPPIINSYTLEITPLFSVFSDLFSFLPGRGFFFLCYKLLNLLTGIQWICSLFRSLLISLYDSGVSSKRYMFILIRETSRWISQKWNNKNTLYIFRFIRRYMTLSYIEYFVWYYHTVPL